MTDGASYKWTKTDRPEGIGGLSRPDSLAVLLALPAIDSLLNTPANRSYSSFVFLEIGLDSW